MVSMNSPCRTCRIIHPGSYPSIQLFVVYISDGSLTIEMLFLSLADDLAGYNDTNLPNPGDLRIEHACIELDLVDRRAECHR